MSTFKNVQHNLQSSDLEQYLQLELVGELNFFVEENNLSLEQLAVQSGVSKEIIEHVLEGQAFHFEVVSKLLQTLQLKVTLSVN